MFLTLCTTWVENTSLCVSVCVYCTISLKKPQQFLKSVKFKITQMANLTKTIDKHATQHAK